ncbi:hypothetical protein GQR58_029730 [Nymphon striatum]|nr:hypothetical protein GQR58_029730 [Nymphon striatum]
MPDIDVPLAGARPAEPPNIIGAARGDPWRCVQPSDVRGRRPGPRRPGSAWARRVQAASSVESDRRFGWFRSTALFPDHYSSEDLLTQPGGWAMLQTFRRSPKCRLSATTTKLLQRWRFIVEDLNQQAMIFTSASTSLTFPVWVFSHYPEGCAFQGHRNRPDYSAAGLIAKGIRATRPRAGADCAQEELRRRNHRWRRHGLATAYYLATNHGHHQCWSSTRYLGAVDRVATRHRPLELS